MESTLVKNPLIPLTASLLRIWALSGNDCYEGRLGGGVLFSSPPLSIFARDRHATAAGTACSVSGREYQNTTAFFAQLALDIASLARCSIPSSLNRCARPDPSSLNRPRTAKCAGDIFVQSGGKKRTGSVLAAADLDELLDVGDLGRHDGREFVRWGLGTVSEGLSLSSLGGEANLMPVWPARGSLNGAVENGRIGSGLGRERSGARRTDCSQTHHTPSMSAHHSSDF